LKKALNNAAGMMRVEGKAGKRRERRDQTGTTGRIRGWAEGADYKLKCGCV
jgi:hypothetical protein